jgi:UDP-glucose 4-epimerase
MTARADAEGPGKAGSCLVTGGAGFIGSHLACRLAELGHRVRVLDNLSTGHRANVERIPGDVDFREGDIRDSRAVGEAVEGIEHVYHLAALSSVPRSIEDPVATTEVNVTGTVRVLEASRRAGVRCVVAASSSSVYGNAQEDVKSEILTPDPISPYGASKLATEFYCRVYARDLGLPTVALRFFNVFGPWQDPESPYAAVLPRFLKAYRDGDSPVIYGDGEQSRDFTFVDNVVDAILRAGRAEKAWGRAVNVACGGAITVNALAREVGLRMESSVVPRHVDERPGDIRHSRADISRARELLGFEPRVSFEEGVERTVRWFQDQEARPSGG